MRSRATASLWAATVYPAVLMLLTACPPGSMSVGSPDGSAALDAGDPLADAGSGVFQDAGPDGGPPGPIVLIFSGQSNMVGAWSFIDDGGAVPRPAFPGGLTAWLADIYRTVADPQHDVTTVSTFDTFIKVDDLVQHHVDCHSDAGCFGTELPVLDALARAGTLGTRPVVIVKAAISGSPIRFWCRDCLGTDGGPSRIGVAAFDYGAKLRTELEDLRGALPGAEFAGLFWFQGESDAVEYARAGARYQANLAQLISELRTAAGAPSMPIFIAEVSTKNERNDPSLSSAAAEANIAATLGPTGPADIASIRTQQRAAHQPDAGLFVADTDTLWRRDFWHLTAGTQFVLGECWAEQLRLQRAGQAAGVSCP